MKQMCHNGNLLCKLLLVFLVCTGKPNMTWSKRPGAAPRTFTLVIDAGHGGKDPGAIGKMAREKNINLAVALAFGRLVESNCSDVQVVYTRKTDIFIPLDRRAEIANKAKADLFISIHTNSLPKGRIALGAETYTLGMARASANLEVAQRENSAILIESNYEERYQGFDPKSAESYIIFEFIQDKNMEQSVKLARLVQQEFHTTAVRPDKGVHQAGFLVLRATSMPSALVELGYISTPDEERFLSSDEGVRKMSRSLYNAFLKYKRAQGKVGTPPTRKGQEVPPETVAPEPEKAAEPNKTPGGTPESAPARTDADTQAENKINTSATKTEADKSASSEAPVFAVQILTSDKKLPTNDRQFKGLKNVDSYRDGRIYKYTWGATTDYTESQKRRREISNLFPQSFVVAFRNGERMDLQQAISEYKQNKNR